MPVGGFQLTASDHNHAVLRHAAAKPLLVGAQRRVIFTADDFGLAPVVNEAVERAHRDGVLASASLMVAAPATADAVERARRLPSLRVGLHLVVVNGRPVLPPEQVPELVDSQGRFPSDLFAAGVRYFASRTARAQLRHEIRAQFDAFRATGLTLDHVNAQNHFHVHPTVFGMILDIGRDYGLRAVRIPREPGTNARLLWPWLTLMTLRARRAGLACNDFVFGMSDTGRMTPARVRRLLQELPRGVSELYFHPATAAWLEGVEAMPGYEFSEEFAALIDPGVADALRASGSVAVTFSELADERGT
jgi:hopanoid biosynthesis associated protein HpnK